MYNVECLHERVGWWSRAECVEVVRKYGENGGGTISGERIVGYEVRGVRLRGVCMGVCMPALSCLSSWYIDRGIDYYCCKDIVTVFPASPKRECLRSPGSLSSVFFPT